MDENIRVVSSCGQDWPADMDLGLALVDFEHSLGIYWLARVLPGQKVSTAIRDAAHGFTTATNAEAQYAFVRSIPGGAEEFMELDGVVLVQAGWVPARCVAIGRGGMEQIKPGFERWRKI